MKNAGAKPTLVAIAGPSEGAVLTLDQLEISVGRDQANTVVLADPSVSARHCLFLCGEGTVTIRDLDPANSSYVNGLPASERLLAEGDWIRIGQSTFGLKIETGTHV